MPKNVPVVSVVIPCYNQGEFLREAVDSVLAQTFQNFEIIIIDDGSTDTRTKRILKNFKAPKTKILRQKNKGVSAARNAAIAKARGLFILPLDADDKVSPNYLKLAVKAMRSDKKLGIACGQTKLFGPETTDWKHPTYTPEAMLFDNALPPASLFRKTTWKKAGGYDEAMNFAEDRDLWLGILEQGLEAKKIVGATYYYRRHAGSVTYALSRGSKGVARQVEMLARMMRKHAKFYLARAETIVRKALGLEPGLEPTGTRPASRNYRKIFCYGKAPRKTSSKK